MKCAWFVAALALGACGKVLEAQPDGGGDDDGGGGDGPPDVPVRGTINVTVLDRANTGAPAVGVDVVFVDPDGSIAGQATTDTDGKASGEILPGGSVTSVAPLGADGKVMVTALAVSPGDDVVLGRTNPDTTAAGTFVVNWTQSPNATNYIVYTPCGFEFVNAQASSTTITLRNHCNPSTMELVVLARNQAGAVLGTSNKKAIQVSAGNTTMPAFTTGGNISFTASYTNISTAAQLTMTRNTPGGLGHQSDTITKSVAGIDATTANVLDLNTESARVDTEFIAGSGQRVEFRQRLAGNASTYGLDFAATALAFVNGPTLDVSTRTITTTTIAAGTSGDAPDLVQYNLSWRRGGSGSFAWTIFSPNLDPITLPALPGDTAVGIPLATDDITTNSVIAYEADTIANYAAIRQAIGTALVDTLEDGPLGNAELGAAGLVRISASN